MKYQKGAAVVALFFAVMLVLGACTDESVPEAKLLSSRVVESPEVQSILDEFSAQKHRLEFVDCGVVYNGQRINIGEDTVSDVVKILGPYDFFNSGFYVWEGIGISFASFTNREEDVASRVDTAKMYFDAQVDERDKEMFRYMSVLNKNIVLFNGVPIDHETSINDFFSRSTYDYGDFRIGDYYYRISTTCAERGVVLNYFFDAIGGWNYGGGGHLRYKTDVDKNNTNLITRIAADLDVQ